MPVYIYTCARKHRTVKLQAPMSRRPATSTCDRCGKRAKRDLLAELGSDNPQNRPYRPMLIHAAGKVMETRREALDLDKVMDAKGFVPCSDDREDD